MRSHVQPLDWLGGSERNAKHCAAALRRHEQVRARTVRAFQSADHPLGARLKRLPACIESDLVQQVAFTAATRRPYKLTVPTEVLA